MIQTSNWLADEPNMSMMVTGREGRDLLKIENIEWLDHRIWPNALELVLEEKKIRSLGSSVSFEGSSKVRNQAYKLPRFPGTLGCLDGRTDREFDDNH
jgi:hypothetical protein